MVSPVLPRLGQLVAFAGWLAFPGPAQDFKRLRDVGDGLIAILSDNHAGYPIEIFKPGRDGALAIIGKVIWWDNRL